MAKKTLDEIKQEVLRRTEKRINPFGHVRREDVEGILKSLVSLDRDHWAEQWSKVGLTYEAKGDELAAKGGDARRIGEAYYSAYDYCRIGRYPCASTPGKKQAYQHSLRMFRKAAKFFGVPLEIGEKPALLAVVRDDGQSERRHRNEGDAIGGEDEDRVRAEIGHLVGLKPRPERRARLGSAAMCARAGDRSPRAWR